MHSPLYLRKKDYFFSGFEPSPVLLYHKTPDLSILSSVKSHRLFAKFRFIAPFGRVNRNNGKWKMYNVKCRYPFGMDLK